jgi:hypothetical protein
MTRTSLSLFCAFSVLFASSISAAQSASQDSTVVLAPQPVSSVALSPQPVADGPRLRASFGGYGGAVIATQNRSFGAGPGLYFDIGVQANNYLALYAHGAFGTLLLINAAHASAIVEVTPVRWFSVGSGVGLMGHIGVGSGSGWQIPLIVGFNIGSNRWPTGARSGLRLAIDGGIGQTFASSPEAYVHIGANVGYVVF